MDLLARREHSSQEMITKLKRRFRKRLEGDDLYHAVVDELVADGLLSDERYAASMARQLVNRAVVPKSYRLNSDKRAVTPTARSTRRFQTVSTGLHSPKKFTSASLEEAVPI